MKFFILIYFAINILTFGYNYPYKDPYLATVVATPIKYMPKFKKVKYEEIDLGKSNEDVPDNLWFLKKFKFGLMAQKKEAPLIFVLAGTGSKYNSSKMITMSQILYSRGFSVVMLPTSFDYSFIVSISETHAPGYLANDGIELYNVMTLALKKIQKKVKYKNIYLTGYSLGGTMSLILGEIDSHEKHFNFKQILAINPAVNLYESAKLLDDYLDDNIDTEEELDFLINKVVTGIIQFSDQNSNLKINEDTIYKLFKQLNMKDKDLEILIGLAFRFISIDVNYITDIMTKSGVYTDPNIKISKYEPMEKYYKNINYSNLQNYITRIGFKTYHKLDNRITLEQLISRSDLRSIDFYLRNAKNITAITNEDELILTRDNLDYLKDVMKDRVKIYPYGGHCGNMFYIENVNYMVDSLLKGDQK